MKHLKPLLFVIGFCTFLMQHTHAAAYQYPQLTNLQTMYIETFDNSEITSKEVYKYCRIYLVSDTGTVMFDSVSIRGRGNASWGGEKKPYRLKFQDKVRLLGNEYAKAKSWTLLSNGLEKLLFRNGLMAFVGKQFDLPFNAACRFIDLYVNNKYRGTYQISDQVEVRKKRVDIDDQDTIVTDPNANISGGYLLEADGYNDAENYFYSSMGTHIRVHSPEPEVINSKQLAYIEDHVNKFEAALNSDDFDDPKKGFRQYLDSTTFLGWYLSSEVGSNSDIFWSIYFYKKKDDEHLYFGPLWDFDLGFNDANRHGDMTELLLADIKFNDNYFTNWFYKIAAGDWFKKAAYERFHKQYTTGHLDDCMLNYVDSVVTLINASQKLNYEIWSISKQTHMETNLFSTYEAYVTDIKKFIKEHNAYIERALGDNYPLTFVPNENYYYQISTKSNSNYLIGIVDSTLESTTACLRSKVNSQLAQQWEFVPTGDYFMIVNARTGKALRNEGASSRTSITTATIDATDKNQLWELDSRFGAYYNIKNVGNGQILTNYSSRMIEENPVNGYYSSYLNGNDNRMWVISPILKSDKIPSAITQAQMDIEYGLNYNEGSKQLHFVAKDLSELVFKASIYNLDGVVSGTFRGDETFDASGLPDGTYIVSWQFAGKSHSTKFLKN